MKLITVDCDIAAKGLEVLINETIPDETAKVVSVGLAYGFATAEHSRCFDPNIVGNIHRPSETWAHLVAMQGRAPGVHNPKFHKVGKTALKTINKLVCERAGLTHDWGDDDEHG